MSSQKTKERVTGFFLAAAAFFVYANSLGNGFVGDDHSVILHNPVLRDSPLSLFNGIDTTSDTELMPFYRPLTYLTFLIEQRIHGLTPFFVRLFNVLLHSANTFLVYRLSRILFKHEHAALFAGLLFAVHPLHTEGVDFNSGGRNTMLSCFFVLAAYLVHRRSVLHDSISTAVAGAFLFLAGLFSKELALAVLPFVAALEIYPLRQQPAGAKSRAALRLLPYLGATLCYLYMRWLTLSRLGIQKGFLPGSGSQAMEAKYSIPGITERLLDNLYIIPKYLQIAIWPTRLSPRYVVPEDLSPLTLTLAVAWLGIIIGLGWLLTKGRSRTTLFGLSWMAAFWLPVSGIIYFSNIPMAERFLYIPAIGFWVIIADQFSRLYPSLNKTRSRYATIAGVLILLILSAITMRRNSDWKSDLTLNTKLVAQYPENPHGHANLGNAYLDRRSNQDLELAENEFSRALTLDPSLHLLHSPLGYIRLVKSDFEGALKHYSETLAVFPKDRDARINSAIALERLGRSREALDAYRHYLTIPGYNNIPGSREYAEERIRVLSTQLGAGN